MNGTDLDGVIRQEIVHLKVQLESMKQTKKRFHGAKEKSNNELLRGNWLPISNTISETTVGIGVRVPFRAQARVLCVFVMQTEEGLI